MAKSKKVDREQLLTYLEAVSPGVTTKDGVEQSSCVVFTGGRIWSFNGEIACNIPSPVSDVEGAIQAKGLLDLFSRVPDELISVRIKNGALQVVGKNKRAQLRMEESIDLKIDAVETATRWVDLPPDFSQGVGMVHSCASKDADEFGLNCVAIHREYIEACDRFQVARYSTGLLLRNRMLIQAVSLKAICNYDMTRYSVTKNWLHFRNNADLILSIRRQTVDFPDLDHLVTGGDGADIIFPASLPKLAERSEIFSANNPESQAVKVTFADGYLTLMGKGPAGMYEERVEASFDGDPISFMASPDILKDMLTKSPQATLIPKDAPKRLWLETGKFTYVAVTAASKTDGE